MHVVLVLFQLTFTLGVGETVEVDDADLSLTFTAVPRDSRCPRDVNCIVAGEALVLFEARRGGETTELSFEIPPGGADEQELDGITIELTELEPETDSTRSIDASDYTATLVVTTP